MTMLDQLLQILSPQKDYDKRKSDSKYRRLKKKGKKNDKKPIVEEKKPYLDPELFKQLPGHVDIRKVVTKPRNIDEREWIATHAIALFHNINQLYGTVSEFCTADTCPIMQGPGQKQYAWVDERGKKLKCTGPQYVDYVMTFCQKCASNQDLFPTKYAQTFHESFYSEIKKILRFLFHVIAHMYYSHFARLKQMDMVGYLTTVFKHFTYLDRDFHLVDRQETSTMDDLVEAMGLFKPMPSSSETSVTERTTGACSAAESPSPSGNRTQQTPTHFHQQQMMHLPPRNNGAPMSIRNFQGWTPT
uniref:MOB kinase activator 2 isoform X2 n=1 Tax=Ciona intestinalis TaxID=7719 RepID=UPI000180CDBF|nr:MOB kinase activator 2 isoform X2 [Ciona intestinalis]|eukprot:XP_002130698.1 MOB kinase activator 2 isoform X2 [Ciona intestinalis]